MDDVIRRTTVRETCPSFYASIGYTLDRDCYPWVAYKGARFLPDDLVGVKTYKECGCDRCREIAKETDWE